MTVTTVEDSGFLKLNEEILRNPYPFYKLVRDQAPVVREPDYGVYLVSRHADVQDVMRHPQVWSSIQQADAPYSPLPAPLDEIIEWRKAQEFGDKLITNDPPDHNRWRSLINRFFTTRKVSELREIIRSHANELLDEFVEDGEAEFVSQYGDVLPRIVIGELVGMPRADIDHYRAVFHPRVEDLVNAAKCPRQVFDKLIADAAATGRADFLLIADYAPGLVQYFFEKVAERRANPTDDIMSTLANATFKDGEEVPLPDIVLLVMTLFVGGADGNTPSLLVNCARALAEHPELQDELRANPELIDTFIEEVLRLEPPVQGMFRTALEDTTLGDVDIKRGEVVMALFAGANRDERVFADPDALDVHRPAAHNHFAFGYGVHLCPGAPLARMEAHVTVTELLRRTENIKLVPDEENDLVVPSVIQRTPARLRLSFDPR